MPDRPRGLRCWPDSDSRALTEIEGTPAVPNQGVHGFDRAALRQARLAAGLSQARLARSIGVRPAAVNGWEVGRHEPTAARIADLARVLGLSARDLLTAGAPSSLRELRDAAGMTGTQVQARIGTRASWLYSIERGEQPLSPLLCQALARVYDVSENAVQNAYNVTLERTR